VTAIDDTELEDRIRRALVMRAAATPPAAVGTPIAQPRRPRSRVLVAGVAAAVVSAAVVAVGVVTARTRPTPSPRTVTTAVPHPPPTVAPFLEGQRVVLTGADDADVRHLFAVMAKDPRITGTPFAVGSQGNAAVVISQQAGMRCMTIAASPTPAGYQGACHPMKRASSWLAVANDEGPNVDARDKRYIVWTDVPAGTSYVMFTYGSSTHWERPWRSVALFTWVGTEPAPRVPLPTAVAYDALGNVIGRAHAPAGPSGG
jgi:hypothetical protein